MFLLLYAQEAIERPAPGDPQGSARGRAPRAQNLPDCTVDDLHERPRQSTEEMSRCERGNKRLPPREPAVSGTFAATAIVANENVVWNLPIHYRRNLTF